MSGAAQITLGGAYKSALESILGAKARVFDYGDLVDFRELWSDANGSPKVQLERGATHRIVIVWHVTALGGGENDRLLIKHLTPLDWALAVSLAVIAGKGAKAPAGIHIVDLTGKRHDEWAVRMRHQILAEMPWVTLHAPLVPEGGDWEMAGYRKGYLPILGEVNSLLGNNWTFNSMGKLPSPKVRLNLAYIAKQWAASVLRTHDHHDLNNIAGPAIVLKMLTGADDTGHGTLASDDYRSSRPLLDSFLKRLVWTGLLPVAPTKYEAPKFSHAVDVVAIDDELSSGWDEVVATLLGIPPNHRKGRPDESLALLYSESRINVHGTTKPYPLLRSLGVTFSSKPQGTAGSNEIAARIVEHWNPDAPIQLDKQLYLQRRFDSPVDQPGNTTSRPWILVLDLRLFSGQKTAERNWFGLLAKAALQLAVLDEDSLAWPSFDEAEHLRNLAEGRMPDDAHIDTALSLFARLCALRWPSVPIVVFSSSGRSGLVRKLADYGNIFLSSPKPNILAGNPIEQWAAFTESWTRDLRGALSLVSVQVNLLRLMRAPSTKQSTNTYKHVVIALDEAGDFSELPKSAIGGVMLIAEAESRENAISLAYKFQEDLRHAGINFYEQRPYYSDAGVGGEAQQNAKSKKTPVHAELAQVVQASRNIKMGVFRYVISRPQYATNAYKDEAYLRGLTRCIELVVCELLPSLGIDWKDRATLSAWFATKQTSFADPASDDPKSGVDEAARAAVKYDFRLGRVEGNLVESLGGFGKAYSVFLAAIGSRERFGDVMAAVVSLRSRKIPYTDDGGRYSPVNDWYCNRCHFIERRQQSRLRGPVPRCTSCSQNDSSYADYSVMSHLADATLSVGRGALKTDYANSLEATYSFDVAESARLLDFLHVCRLFDARRDQDALKLAYQNGNFLDGLNTRESGAQGPLHARLTQQLKATVPNIKGIALTELAGIRTRGVVIPPMQQGGRSQKSQSKPVKHQNDHPKRQRSTKISDELREVHRERGSSLGDQKTDHLSARLRVTVVDFQDRTHCEKLLRSCLAEVLDGSSTISKGRTASGREKLTFDIDMKYQAAIKAKLEIALQELGRVEFNPVK